MVQNRTLPRDLVVFGELGLTGEVRPVSNGQQRLTEPASTAFEGPSCRAGNRPKSALIRYERTRGGLGGERRREWLNEVLDVLNEGA